MPEQDGPDKSQEHGGQIPRIPGAQGPSPEVPGDQEPSPKEPSAQGPEKAQPPREEARGLDEIEVDTENLWREESFTDLQIATVRRLTPVHTDGSVDTSRRPLFIGQTTILTEAGPIPIQARLPGDTLAEALEYFPQAIRRAVAQMVDEIRELQRQQASRIVVPSGMPPGSIPGGPRRGPQGGGPGGIQLP